MQPCYLTPVLISHLVIYQLRNVFSFKSIQEHDCAHHHSTQKYLVSERLCCSVASNRNLLTSVGMHINLILTYDRKRYNLHCGQFKRLYKQAIVLNSLTEAQRCCKNYTFGNTIVSTLTNASKLCFYPGNFNSDISSLVHRCDNCSL